MNYNSAVNYDSLPYHTDVKAKALNLRDWLSRQEYDHTILESHVWPNSVAIRSRADRRICIKVDLTNTVFVDRVVKGYVRSTQQSFQTFELASAFATSQIPTL